MTQPRLAATQPKNKRVAAIFGSDTAAPSHVTAMQSHDTAIPGHDTAILGHDTTYEATTTPQPSVSPPRIAKRPSFRGGLVTKP